MVKQQSSSVWVARHGGLLMGTWPVATSSSQILRELHSTWGPTVRTGATLSLESAEGLLD